MKRIYLILLLGLSCGFIMGQDQSVREELQRYIGYEPGTYKYLTLPYDQTMGSNVAGNYQDLGFILLLMVGLIILNNGRRKWWHFLIIVFSLLLYLSSSLYYGKVLINNLYYIPSDPSFAETINNWETDWMNALVGKLYYYNAHYLGGLFEWSEGLFTEADYVSIPLLAVAFLAAIYYANRTFRSRKNSQVVQLVFIALISMGFYWVILSAGVLWYGFVVFALAFILFAAGYGHLHEQSRWARWLYLTPVFISMILNVSYKTANVYVDNSIANFIIDPSIWLYYSDKSDEGAVLDSYLSNLSRLSEEINQVNPDAKIYKMGTGFNYLIDNNNQRVFEDNQLSFWQQLDSKYSAEEIGPVLKANGFEYLLIGLKLWTLDNTPEKSLQRKFKSLMRFIDNSPDLSLVATDRVLQDPNTKEYRYVLSGGEMAYYGYYALLKIN